MIIVHISRVGGWEMIALTGYWSKLLNSRVQVIIVRVIFQIQIRYMIHLAFSPS